MITQKQLKNQFDYQDGNLVRKIPSNNQVKVGDIAGSIHTNGYRYISVNGRCYLAHRLVYLYHYGYFPFRVDHKNGIRDDNRIGNIRSCSRSQNNFNESLRPNNTSGVKGVCWLKSTRRWIARIQFNKKVLYLGSFVYLKDASEIMKEARSKN